jgi:hypothetical protein
MYRSGVRGWDAPYQVTIWSLITHNTHTMTHKQAQAYKPHNKRASNWSYLFFVDPRSRFRSNGNRQQGNASLTTAEPNGAIAKIL